MSEVVTRAARSDDLDAVRALVTAAGLPDADIADHFPRAYVVLEEAQRLNRVYLLTTTAPEYFARLGFERIARESEPPPLQRSSEFATVCPASAICMVKRLAI